MPEVSIIVPVYNGEKTLERCIDSILCQTFTDFELILIDDGSQDRSGAICDKYAEQDPRVRIIHRSNGGPSRARNAGMAAAAGRYLMFCDCDDYVTEDWCRLLADTIRKNEGAWVVSNAYKVDPDGRAVPIDDLQHHPKSETYADIYQKYLSPYSWNKIYRTDVIRENGLRFPEDAELGEDAIFNTEYYRFCSSVSYILTPLYYYCTNPESAMQKYRPNRFELDARLFRARLPLIREEELGEFCDRYLYFFVTLLDVVFDERNPMTKREKLQYNQRMMNSEEFRFCAAHAAGKNESELYMKVLRTHNYRIYRLFKRLVLLKHGTRRDM